MNWAFAVAALIVLTAGPFSTRTASAQGAVFTTLGKSDAQNIQIDAISPSAQWCAPEITLRAVGPNAAAFAAPAFQTLIRNLAQRKVIVECPEARRFQIQGVVSGKLNEIVWRGAARLDDNWTTQAVAAPPEPVVRSAPTPVIGYWISRFNCRIYNRDIPATLYFSVDRAVDNRYPVSFRIIPDDYSSSIESRFPQTLKGFEGVVDAKNNSFVVTREQVRAQNWAINAAPDQMTLNSRNHDFATSCQNIEGLTLYRVSTFPLHQFEMAELTRRGPQMQQQAASIWIETRGGFGKEKGAAAATFSCSTLLEWLKSFQLEEVSESHLSGREIVHHWDDSTTIKYFGKSAFYWDKADYLALEALLSNGRKEYCSFLQTQALSRLWNSVRDRGLDEVRRLAHFDAAIPDLMRRHFANSTPLYAALQVEDLGFFKTDSDFNQFVSSAFQTINLGYSIEKLQRTRAIEKYLGRQGLVARAWHAADPTKVEILAQSISQLSKSLTPTRPTLDHMIGLLNSARTSTATPALTAALTEMNQAVIGLVDRVLSASLVEAKAAASDAAFEKLYGEAQALMGRLPNAIDVNAPAMTGFEAEKRRRGVLKVVAQLDGLEKIMEQPIPSQEEIARVKRALQGVDQTLLSSDPAAEQRVAALSAVLSEAVRAHAAAEISVVSIPDGDAPVADLAEGLSRLGEISRKIAVLQTSSKDDAPLEFGAWRDRASLAEGKLTAAVLERFKTEVAALPGAFSSLLGVDRRLATISQAMPNSELATQATALASAARERIIAAAITDRLAELAKDGVNLAGALDQAQRDAALVEKISPQKAADFRAQADKLLRPRVIAQVPAPTDMRGVKNAAVTALGATLFWSGALEKLSGAPLKSSKEIATDTLTLFETACDITLKRLDVSEREKNRKVIAGDGVMSFSDAVCMLDDLGLAPTAWKSSSDGGRLEGYRVTRPRRDAPGEYLLDFGAWFNERLAVPLPFSITFKTIDLGDKSQALVGAVLSDGVSQRQLTMRHWQENGSVLSAAKENEIKGCEAKETTGFSRFSPPLPTLKALSLLCEARTAP